MPKIIDSDRLNRFLINLKTFLSSNYVALESGKDLSSNDFTNAYKTKLDGIASGATKNSVSITQHVNSGTSSATVIIDDVATDIYFNDTNTVYQNATTSTAGLMSAADKTKLTNLPSDPLEEADITSAMSYNSSNGTFIGEFYVGSTTHSIYAPAYSGQTINVSTSAPASGTDSSVITLVIL